MLCEQETIWCDGCGVEIVWSPVREAGRNFCCDDCRYGLPCECGDDLEEAERRARLGTTSVADSGHEG